MIDGGHKTAVKVVQNYFCQMNRLSIVFPVNETKKLSKLKEKII